MAFELVARESVLGDEHLLERGHHFPRARARAACRRRAPCASRGPRSLRRRAPWRPSSLVAATLVGRQERDAGRVRAARRAGRSRRPRGRSASGIWIEDAGAVAGVGLGAGRAAVVQAADRGERLLDDVVARAALHVDDEARRRTRRARSGGRRAAEARVRRSGGHAVSSSDPGRSVPVGSWPPRDDIGPSAEHGTV